MYKKNNFQVIGKTDNFIIYGCGVVRKYALPEGTSWTVWLGNIFLASSAEIDGITIHESPDFQSAGVATFLVAVNWRESKTLRISLKIKMYFLKSYKIRNSIIHKRHTRPTNIEPLAQ